MQFIALLAFSFMVTVGCQQAQKVQAETMENYQVINLQANFADFWEKAKSKPFDEQVRIWDDVVESKHLNFYDSLVWSKNSHKDWQDRKKKKLQQYFKFYGANVSSVLEAFHAFPSVLQKQIEKYKNVFPDARFALSIYAAPTAGNFNGRAGDLANAPGKTVLAFGIDTIINQKDDADVLYSHELFHIYHVGLLDLNEAKAITATMSLPLWLEGLATYASSILNPKADEAAILLDADLPKIKSKELPWLASEFLKVIEKKAWAGDDPYPYQAWFGIGKERPRADLPARCGYLLGLEVVRELTRKYSLKEMVRWDVGEIHSRVTEALTSIKTRKI